MKITLSVMVICVLLSMCSFYKISNNFPLNFWLSKYTYLASFIFLTIGLSTFTKEKVYCDSNTCYESYESYYDTSVEGLSDDDWICGHCEAWSVGLAFILFAFYLFMFKFVFDRRTLDCGEFIERLELIVSDNALKFTSRLEDISKCLMLIFVKNQELEISNDLTLICIDRYERSIKFDNVTIEYKINRISYTKFILSFITLIIGIVFPSALVIGLSFVITFIAIIEFLYEEALLKDNILILECILYKSKLFKNKLASNNQVISE